MRIVVALGLLVGVLVVGGRPAGGPPPVPAPSGSPLLRSIPLSAAAFAVDEQAGRVFVAGGGPVTPGYVTTLDARDGRLLRRVQVGIEPYALALDPFTGRVFVGNYTSGTVSVLDARSGALLRTVALGGHPHALAVDAAAGRVFALVAGVITATAGAVATLDARDGSVLRRVGLGEELTAIAASPETARVFVVKSAASVPNGDKVLVLDAHSQKVLRTTPVASAGVIVVDARLRRVFVAAGDGVSVLDAHSGAVIKKISPIGGVLAIAVASQAGRVFAVIDYGGSSGALAVLDAGAGTLLRTVSFDRSVAATPGVDEQTHRVYVSLHSMNVHDHYDEPINPGVLRVLDSRSGLPLQNLTLPDTISSSGGIVVDARARRVFVFTDHFVNVYDTARL